MKIELFKGLKRLKTLNMIDISLVESVLELERLEILKSNKIKEILKDTYDWPI